MRAPFSAIYQFLKSSPAKRIAQLDSLKLPAEIKNALKEKLYLLYSQNYSKIGLLTNYKFEAQNPSACNQQALTEGPLEFASCQWKLNVVLSTNYLNKVLRPEVVIEIQTAQNVKVRMILSVEKFEELRRKVSYLLRYAQQIECIRYLNI